MSDPYQPPEPVEDIDPFDWLSWIWGCLDFVAMGFIALLTLMLFPISAAVFLINLWLENSGQPIGLESPPSWFINVEGFCCSAFWFWFLVYYLLGG